MRIENDSKSAGLTTKRLVRLAVFTAIALIIHTVEALVPLPVPIPGVKLGLSNIVTLFMLFTGGGADALIVLLCRITLGALIAGRPVMFIYSMAGGLMAFAAMIAVKRIVTEKQIWVCGAIGAVFHNIGQIAAAVVVLGTTAIIVYLPVLIIAGIATGAVTGIIAQLTLGRFSKMQDMNNS